MACPGDEYECLISKREKLVTTDRIKSKSGCEAGALTRPNVIQSPSLGSHKFVRLERKLSGLSECFVYEITRHFYDQSRLSS